MLDQTTIHICSIKIYFMLVNTFIKASLAYYLRFHIHISPNIIPTVTHDQLSIINIFGDLLHKTSNLDVEDKYLVNFDNKLLFTYISV